MVKVRLFGLLRLDTGLRELEADVKTVRELYAVLLSEAKKAKPDTKITSKDIDGCIVTVNGKAGKKGSRLSDGDEVILMSPVCGG